MVASVALPMPDAVPSSGYEWQYQDDRGVARAIEQALSRASKSSWKKTALAESSGTPAADLRALLLNAFWAVANAGAKGPSVAGAGEKAILSIEFAGGRLVPRMAHAYMTGIAPWVLIGKDALSSSDVALRPRMLVQTATGAGGPPRAQIQEAGFLSTLMPALVQFARIVGPWVGAGLLMKMAGLSEVITDRLESDPELAQMVAAATRQNQIQQAHAAREDTAGAVLPYSADESSQIAAAKEDFEEARKQRNERLGIRMNANSGDSWLFPGIVLGASALGAFLLWQGNKRG